MTGPTQGRWTEATEARPQARLSQAAPNLMLRLGLRVSAAACSSSPRYSTSDRPPTPPRSAIVPPPSKTCMQAAFALAALQEIPEQVAAINQRRLLGKAFAAGDSRLGEKPRAPPLFA